MRSFILATVVATATAMVYENEMTIIDMAELKDSTVDYGKLTVKTGWKKNGESSDAILDLMLSIEATNAGETNYMVSSDAVWFMGISRDETTAESEVQKIST